MRTKAAKLKRKAELELAFKDDPEARARIKAMGIAVGMTVRYNADGSTNHYGTVRELHQKSVDIVLTGERFGPKYARMTLREDTVPFSGIVEVLGPGTPIPDDLLPVKPPTTERSQMSPPPRDGGYEFCDIGECDKRPTRAYSIRKYDPEVGELGPLHIVALCKGHDEPYIAPTDKAPAHIPLLWQMGVVGDSWAVPKPEGEPEPTVTEKMAKVREARKTKAEPERENGEPLNTNPASDSPYEGKRGRHPTDCACSKHGGVSA